MGNRTILAVNGKNSCIPWRNFNVLLKVKRWEVCHNFSLVRLELVVVQSNQFKIIKYSTSRQFTKCNESYLNLLQATAVVV